MSTHQHRRLQQELIRLKQQCPMPMLMRKLGLGAYARSSCRSPFREDQNPSWGIFQRQGGWHFKDFSDGDSGDEVTLLARFKGWDVKEDFKRIVALYTATAAQPDAVDQMLIQPATASPPTPPDLSGLTSGTVEQLQQLSELRSISVAALELAVERGFLVFGICCDAEVFGLKDASGRLAETRRLDGELFPAIGSLPQRKSHTLRGSTKSWPLGMLESASCSRIALVEGLPDFLACFDFLLREDKFNVVAPISILSASANLSDEALTLFNGKHVRMFPHYDVAGMEAARRWTLQLNSTAARIDYFDFGQFLNINDLADLNCGVSTNSIHLNEPVLP